MAYCTANEAVKLMEFRKAYDNMEAMTLLLTVMEAVNDKIVAAANMAKGNVRHDVSTNFFREERPNVRVMEVLVEKLADKLCELGFYVVKENKTTLNIYWHTDSPR